LPRRWHLAHGKHLDLGPQGRIMAVLNVTPDSFSDGGRHSTLDTALRQAARMIEDGADIIDIGGESTRPGAVPVSGEEEQARILPVIESIAARHDILISVDTYRAGTARMAVEAGAHIVNDVWGLQRDPAIASVAAQTGAGLVIMHTGREREKLPDPVADQFHFLQRSLEIAAQAGVSQGQIVLDPGFGFAKDVSENLALMARFDELEALGHPILAGTSRKRFIGAVTGREGDLRDWGTAATSAILRMKGAAILRVHEVPINLDAVRMADAVMFHAPGKDQGHG
jgi:dihydropteroate synthase